MSEDSEFDEFLARARESHLPESAPPSAARRLEDAVGSRVQWRRRVSPKVASALAVMMSARASAARVGKAGETASRQPGLVGQWSWTKLFAVLVPALGLAAMSYSIESVTSSPAPSSVAASCSATARLPISASPSPAPPPPTTADSNEPEPEPAALARPGDLPDAKVLPSARAPSEPPSRPKASRANRANDGQFEAELALLTQVTAARRERRSARALELIEERDRRFPDGALTPEYAGERVLALAALGRDAEACTLARAFLAKYPTSPFVPEVRSACADSIPTR